MSRHHAWGTGFVLLLVGIFWLASWWRFPPAVEFDNLKYIQLLRTAVSARNPEWLAKVSSAVDHRLAAGEMSSSEHAHFASLIAMARGGAWKEADVACFRFEEAQLGRRRSRPPSAD
jgi:hypothetical protein